MQICTKHRCNAQKATSISFSISLDEDGKENQLKLKEAESKSQGRPMTPEAAMSHASSNLE